MKKYAFFVIIIISVATGLYLFTQSNEVPIRVTDSDQSVAKNKDDQFPEKENDPADDIKNYDINTESSLQVIVNKTRPISLDYVPQNLVTPDVPTTSSWQLRAEAATALEEMFAAAKLRGIDLVLGSGYRSSATQKSLYDSYVANFGQTEADTFSARPGTSEHQLGLAADLSSLSRVCFLEICYEDTTEGKWLKENAHQFGFIIRYPKDKESITGYQYEPWHIRYLGGELANTLIKADQTVEEYFSL